ncbi:hypothetical protein WUBG_04131 [Wuchereria bancrofti]|uniref:Uncharacterized protein n=1 Tax=Wuchereria bancrofti TaxID=6293 RepID=J9EQY9_WUCBA|nr:hypothetical protein WUBG_04131 [Wuchereria bancrofti]
MDSGVSPVFHCKSQQFLKMYCFPASLVSRSRSVCNFMKCLHVHRVVLQYLPCISVRKSYVVSSRCAFLLFHYLKSEFVVHIQNPNECPLFLNIFEPKFPSAFLSLIPLWRCFPVTVMLTEESSKFLNSVFCSFSLLLLVMAGIKVRNLWEGVVDKTKNGSSDNSDKRRDQDDNFQ